jgi:hypothetical protein
VRIQPVSSEGNLLWLTDQGHHEPLLQPSAEAAVPLPPPDQQPAARQVTSHRHLAVLISTVRMMEPPSRASMWRVGFPTPKVDIILINLAS